MTYGELKETQRWAHEIAQRLDDDAEIRHAFMTALLGKLGEKYCPHCWVAPRGCHCANDE